MTTKDSNNKQVGRQKQSKWLIAIGFIAVLGVIFFAMLTVKEQIRYSVFNVIDDLT